MNAKQARALAPVLLALLLVAGCTTTHPGHSSKSWTQTAGVAEQERLFDAAVNSDWLGPD